MDRALVDKAFTAARVDKLEGFIEGLVNVLIDEFIDEGEVEFVSRFAIPLPMRVINDELGFSPDDLHKCRRWSDLTVETMSPVIPPDRELAIAPEIIEMQNHFARSIEAARKQPADNLVSLLANGTVEGRPLTMQEMVIIMQNFLVAGNETTASALCHGIQLMVENPSAMAMMRRDPSTISQFIDEVLRLMAPVQGLFRKAKEDMEIAGVKIPKGAVLQVQYGAANRDPAMFADAAHLDMTRPNANKHMAFGAGIHYCVGHQLARKELLVGFRTLLRRMKNLRGARGAESFVIADSYTTFGHSALHLAFDKA
jgi:cytochrome P450